VGRKSCVNLSVCPKGKKTKDGEVKSGVGTRRNQQRRKENYGSFGEEEKKAYGTPRRDIGAKKGPEKLLTKGGVSGLKGLTNPIRETKKKGTRGGEDRPAQAFFGGGLGKGTDDWGGGDHWFLEAGQKLKKKNNNNGKEKE